MSALTLVFPLVSLLILSLPKLPLQLSEADSAAFAEFEERLQQYVTLRKKLDATLRELPEHPSPAAVAARSRALAQAIRTARSQARQGDVFTPQIEVAFKRIIRRQMAGAEGVLLRNAIRDGNPKVEGNASRIQLVANAHYPEDQPLSTIPPGLLRQLPPLPPYLEYRFVGQDLILHDNYARLIVDVIRRAAP